MADENTQLRAELEKRRRWFFETQLRRLNLQTFRDIEHETKDPDRQRLLSLISEPVSPAQPESVPGHPEFRRARVYLDSHEPVWTADEQVRRKAFAGTLIGKNGDWLDFREPRRLIERLETLATTFEEDRFTSAHEPSALGDYRRKPATFVPELPNWVPGQMFDPLKGEEPKDGEDQVTDGRGQAISRAFVAQEKPWLLPELYHPAHRDPQAFAKTGASEWLADLEKFITDFEAELRIVLGDSAAQKFTFADDDFGKEIYRQEINRALRSMTTGDAADRVKAQFLSSVDILDDRRVPVPHYRFGVRVETAGYKLDDIEKFPHSEMAKYWLRVVKHGLREVYANKENSDMGLCHLIRILYLFGTIPAKVASDEALRWRKRPELPPDFGEFFRKRAAEQAFIDDPGLLSRLNTARDKLSVILHESAAVPGSAAITFSPIAQEVLRQGIRHYKFWLDEPARAMKNSFFQKVRTDLGYEAESEMEYWSENHYIMFASSEYLAGQLWESDTFDVRDFADGRPDSGARSGKERKERGRARVLRWLNHRLLMGWTEFNSSGYYREHLWSLLNLIDFALDPEVREKATLATDLLLFDVARFMHKGAMGAVGGRSQFSSKMTGRDNALSDAIELLFGTRGLWFDDDSEIGAAMATSTYRIPEVLLEIACNPPKSAVMDRSRVSITFDEAYKYGIWFSQENDKDTFDSHREGYAPKLKKYLPFVDKVDTDIERTHPGYSRRDDNIVFWWGTSAFLNKQVTRGTLACVDKFDLGQSGVFKQLATVVGTLLPKVKGGSIFGVIGGLVGGVYGFLAGAVLGAILQMDDAEDIADDLSIFLEGSTRTRANILTYRNPDIMLSSIQNFRAGQMNIQSNVNQATVNGTLNVFSTSGLVNLDVSPVLAAAVGALGGALVAGPPGAIVGGVAAVALNESQLTGSRIFRTSSDGVDGLDWWTGYFALPMVVQHGPAAIIAYDFHDVQNDIADCGSHVYFPKVGFDRVDEVRCSAYDDANSPLFENFDVFHYGPKGFWLFGKYTHQDPGVPAADRSEAYIGVFSNQHPTWLSLQEDEVDVYNQAVDEVARKPIGDLVRAIAQEQDAEKREALLTKLRELQRIWPDPLPRDYFADRDWHHDGKNIWIVQVGNKTEFGDYETFKQRVSSARVHLDDFNDMECHYHMPMPDGSSKVLALKYEEQEFHYGNAPLQTDLYPRFENDFVRGGRVEWGQRSYVIEYRGQSLLHNLHDFDHPVRSEQAPVLPSDADKVLGLVVFVRTKDEDMDEKTLGTATVGIGCTTVTEHQIIAVGPVDDDNAHDTEWIFFDSGPVAAAPDLTIDVGHRAFSDGDNEADWNMGFSLQALMGDHTLRDVTLNWDSSDFDEDVRNTGPLPFAIRTDRWRAWEPVPDSHVRGKVVLGAQGEREQFYYDHSDLFYTTPNEPLRHRRLDPCLTAAPRWTEIPSEHGGPQFTPACSVGAVSRLPGHLIAAVLDEGKLFLSSIIDKDGTWDPWTPEEVGFGAAVPLATPGTLFAGPAQGSLEGVELLVPGADGHLYIHFDRRSRLSFDLPQGQTARYWHQLVVDKFALRADGDIATTVDRVFVLATDGALWATPIIRAELIPPTPSWTKVSDRQSFRTFTVATDGTRTRVLATTAGGDVWDCTLDPGQPPQWAQLSRPGGAQLPAQVGVACAVPEPGRLDIFTVAADGTAFTSSWTEPTQWQAWTPIVEGEQGFRAAPRTPLLLHRVKRQVELLIRTDADDLTRTWWS
ncbi:hypothetical protein [Nocardia sp. NPDC052112]|uniref:hypothetical protein n=1 Tax=Nocardia sp. NPDC052112 TaxID=3155646 RepID=UPI0034283E8D